ncbi:MAG: CotH kinase family protein, partial [Bacteroidales bacterium]|nr:CotH kinase family protein [Bacteroidales bacterium]
VQGEHDYAYRSYIDVPSFINYYIIQEITKNPDGNVRKSTYLTKEKGKPLEMYHVWDFDITLGNCDYTNFEKPEGWQMRYVKWYNQLFFDPAFKKSVVDRWNELYPTLLTQVPAFLDRQYALMAGAEARNFDRWQILGVKVWPNYYYFPTYGQEYDFLKDFYADRLAWLNGMINSSEY